MNRLATACLLFLLAACAGGPVPPAWQADAHGSLKAFVDAYLEGNARVADFEFARARASLARTGRPDLLARAELTRCAARVASLEFDACPAFAGLASDAGEAERAYADYLAGRAPSGDNALLPAPHRAVAASGEAALASIEDPLARLIAAGVLLRAERLSPAGIKLAADTASAQGWRRPLLAWLGLQEKRAAASGDAAAVDALGRRRRIVSGE